MNARNILRSTSIALAAAVLVAVSAAESRGQAFGFSISSGGGGHHHHHGGGWWAGYSYNPYWGPRWYGPPAVVYAPPPLVQERVIYVQPSTPSYLPPPPATPLSSATTAPPVVASANDDRVVIRNSAGARLPVSFVMDGQDVELGDGATRTFVGASHRTVQYDRGGQFGSTQQELTGGQYEFRITASGWDLVRRPDIPAASRTAVKSNSLPSTATSR